MASPAKLIGPGGRLFAETAPGSDESTFRTDNTSAAYYNSPYYKLHQYQVQPIPAPRNNATPQLDLADFVGPEIIAGIERAGTITFHSVGDTGAAKVNRAQTVQRAIADEAEVADAMSAEVASGANVPAFFFHLGDVIYNFGEAQYYYDQFYEPFRAYDRPIFAIPGNHDGMVFGQSSSAPQVPTLDAFLTNFCAATAGPSPDSGGLVRSVMTQPGVYFTLDAPYVSIIGVYSNVLDGPGVISSQGGHFPIVDDQLGFLVSELKRLAPDRNAGKRAVIVAVHHPPLSADAQHAGSTGVQTDLDRACQEAGLWPDAVLSGHAHLYQRFTRIAGPHKKQTPYVVAGSGGFAITPPQTKLGPAPITVGDHTLEVDPIVKFGYLTITCDARTLCIRFKSPASGGGVDVLDSVCVDLKSGTLMPPPKPNGGRSPRSSSPAASASHRSKKTSPARRGRVRAD
jgi:calcineurin-like phosphoesterase family protein